MGADPSRPVIGLVIIEDHPFYREYLVQITDADPGMKVVASESAVEAVTEKDFGRADVVVLDLGLPAGRSGTEAVRYVSERGGKVLVLTATETAVTVAYAITAGARGYLTKQCEKTEYLSAVREVARGGTYVDPRKVGPDLAAQLLAHRSVELTARQCQALELVAEGETDQGIADQLSLTLAGVRSHLDRIGDKVGGRRRFSLIRYARDHGIVPPSC